MEIEDGVHFRGVVRGMVWMKKFWGASGSVEARNCEMMDASSCSYRMW